MIILNEKDLYSTLGYSALIEELRIAFALNPALPNRQHLLVPQDDTTDATLLLMPAWDDRFLGVKIATVFPGNVSLGKPAVEATYLLKSGTTGELLAIMDGSALTKIRTAAASALASTFLSRQDSKTLLMVGAGALAAPLILAHSAVRDLDRVLVYNRTKSRADALIDQLKDQIDVQYVSDLDAAVPSADIISCATLSSTPLIKGHLVSAGTHVDLVGAYSPTMRESDTHLIERSRVFVDTRIGAIHEAGDLVLAETESAWRMSMIVAELSELCGGTVGGRAHGDEITVFKSVGASLEDLVAASLAYRETRS
jgi:ornithine cyclodeaminase/alanine dehydrogenase-like protein (mu-crystallin family)